MDTINLQGNNTHPSVVFDPENGLFNISGRSLMDDAELFYRELLAWFDEFAKNPTDIEFTMDMECFNIASSKRLLFLFYKLEEIHKSEKAVVSVTWCYSNDADDMFEVGQDFAVMVKIPFNFCVCSPLEEPVLV
ncbi:MAG: DUF1987 domain-containing protein [Flavobacteriales bacterium]|nr:DUF1987 domain-containing protein [Flavobacteriales bacterium]